MMRITTNWRSDLLNLVAAAIIALLIWAYANDRTRESVTAAGTVRFTVADPRAQYVEPSGSVSVTVEVRGSRRALERIEDELRNGVMLSSGKGDIPSAAGEHTIDLAEALAHEPAFAAMGVEIVRVRPESQRISVGTLATEQVPVTAVLPSAAVQGDIVVDPPVVAVTLPAEARAAVGALNVDAVVDTKNMEPGKPQQVDVDLRLPEALARWKELCRVVPPRGKVSFTLLATSGEAKLARVPVRLSVGPDAFARWDIAPAQGFDAVAGVVVTGPRAAIASIERGEFLPAAVVDIPEGALVRPGTVELPVTFWRLPEGVSVIDVAGTARGTAPRVTVRVAPRPESEPR